MPRAISKPRSLPKVQRCVPDRDGSLDVAGGIAILVCVLALIGAGELLIRVVEGAIAGPFADPMPRAHGDVPNLPPDPLNLLRDQGAL